MVDLADAINESFADGWLCQGGLCYAPPNLLEQTAGPHPWVQALVRNDSPELLPSPPLDE